MQEKERKALNRCFEDLVRDLYPTQTFLHSLYAEDILTEEQMDNILIANSRETQVHLLLRYLPHRGPRAFTVFKDKLSKDHPWLCDKLTEELGKLQTGQEKMNKKLLMVIATKLIPLVSTDNSYIADAIDENVHPSTLIQKFADLLHNLEVKCRNALNMKADIALPLHRLIEERLAEDRLKLEMAKNEKEDGNLKEISKENRELKRQLKDVAKTNKDMMKMKAEIEKLKQTVKKQKEKIKEQAKASQEQRRRIQEVDKLKKEIEVLKAENENLKMQLISGTDRDFMLR